MVFNKKYKNISFALLSFLILFLSLHSWREVEKTHQEARVEIHHKILANPQDAIDYWVIKHHKDSDSNDGITINYCNELLLLQIDPINWNDWVDKHHKCGYGYIVLSEKDDIELQQGIEYFEEKAQDRYEVGKRRLLAKFYCFTHSKYKNVSRGLFWAHRGAEFGESQGMLLLAHAYAKGIGVMQDLEESIKWLLLAEKAPNDSSGYLARKILKSLEDFSLKKELIELKAKSLEKAKLWAQEHPDAFFYSP
jgi:hypothetical protein